MFRILILVLFSSQVFADFEQWKKDYARRASKRGLSKSYILKTLKDVKVDPVVIEKDRNQVIMDPDRDYQEFMQRWLRESPSRIEEGKKHLKENWDLLSRIEKKYRVDKEVIVSLWGTETLYGQITGDYDLIRSLATLSYDRRRRKFFETQLSAAIRLLKQGHATREQLKGSWAGATGQCQFMPSNIPLYAQDFNGDGKKDIWGTKEDVFASIANYLKKSGWKKGKDIGDLAYNTRNKKLNLNRYRSLNAYNRLGFKTLEGKKISGRWKRRRLAEIPLKNAPLILRGSNYSPMRKWNRSNLFAAFNIILMDGFKQ